MGRCLLLAAICLGMTGKTLSADASGDQSPFAQTVLREFDKWDKDDEGKLTFGVIERWTRDPSLHGDEAAAMAVLHIALRNEIALAAASKEPRIPEVTRSYIERYGRMPAEQRRAESDFDACFRICRDKIGKESRELFPEDMPRLSAVHQGNIGDCHFLAPVGSMVSKRPDELKAMIRGDQEHGYSVQFPRRQPIGVAPLTDTELGLFSSAGGNGIWLAVLEKACGEVHREGLHMKTLDDADALAAGPHKVCIDIALLTGHKPERLAIPNPSKRPLKALEGERELRRRLAELEHERRICTAISRRKADVALPPGMVGDHAYAILGYNRSTDIVQLWNPWGKDFTPQGDDGLQTGYKTVHGVFEMPLKDFANQLLIVYNETNEPIVHAVK